MLETIFPKKLKPGDEIRVIAPASSLALISEENINLAQKKLEEAGFRVTFSRNARECDALYSSSIKSRIEDFHEAFSDSNVKGVLAVIGGFNSNQLLPYLDYELIRQNPKVFCGFSDITALSGAILAKSGLTTYYGPAFSTLAMQKESDYNWEYFRKCLCQEGIFFVDPSATWSDDAWYLDQEKRTLEKNEGWLVLREGETEGKIIGGNLCTLNLLQGTEFMPDLKDSILFLEDDGESREVIFDRDLQSLLQQPSFVGVRALVIGRFQRKSQMNAEKLRRIIETKKELDGLPILANVNFGHTNPIITFPIGGRCKLIAKREKSSLEIIKH